MQNPVGHLTNGIYSDPSTRWGIHYRIQVDNLFCAFLEWSAEDERTIYTISIMFLLCT